MEGDQPWWAIFVIAAVVTVVLGAVVLSVIGAVALSVTWTRSRMRRRASDGRSGR